MTLQFRRITREELSGFRPYLLPETVRAIERRDMAVMAWGAVTGCHACGAAAVRLETESAELTDLFVDAAARGQGVGGQLLAYLLKQAPTQLLQADYVLREPELSVMDTLLTQQGFSAPQQRSRVFQASSSEFHEAHLLKAAFQSRYDAPEEVVPFFQIPGEMLTELEQAADIPENLGWQRLKKTALPELSVALLSEKRVEAYLLARESADGSCVLLAAVNRGKAPFHAFMELLVDLLHRYYYRSGGDFTFCFSALTPRVEQLAIRLLGNHYVDYREHTCFYLLNE